MAESNAKVFIRDQAYAWLPGSVVFVKDGQAFVRVELPDNWHSTTALCQDSGLEEIEDALIANNQEEKKPNAFRAIPLAQYPNQQLPLQNQCGHQGDMSDLPQLHEAAMLYNLKERHALGKPYTRVANIMVAVNPFERNEKLYCWETQQSYAEKLVWNAPSFEEEKKEDGIQCNDTRELEPHVYEVSSSVYRSLVLDRRDQTILLSGESGSGKTETVKIVLEHLANMEQFRQNRDLPAGTAHTNGGIVEKVLQSSFVFEAFGNAKTQRNHNSSRFGKYLQLHYTEVSLEKLSTEYDNKLGEIPSHCLAGSACTMYFLEKSRVISRAKGERSFHIFYQLLRAPEEFRRDLWPFFAACKVEDYSYLADTGDDYSQNVKDSREWEQTLRALEGLGIQGSLLKTLMKAVAVVLQLGNIQFATEKSPKAGPKTVVSSAAELDILCEMVGIERKELEAALTSRVVKTNVDESFRAPLDSMAAKEATDALAKEIYSLIFQSVTRHVNDETKSMFANSASGNIGLLDMFGFERLSLNQFEQLCINYANEQLQQKYVADNFRVLKTEYDEEGIDIFDFSLLDNSSVLHLLDGRNGVFVTLQEECTRANGNAESFVQRAKESNKSNERFLDQKHFKKTEFGISHFAGPCKYDATNFVGRNMDKMSEELMACMSKTTNNVIRKELHYALQRQPQADLRRKQKSGMTVLEKFCIELRDLLKTIEETDTRFIRCVLPNGTRSPRLLNHLMTLQQLECAGLMTAIALSRESFPDTLSYKTLLSRFACLMKSNDRQNMKQMAIPDQIVYMLTNLFMSMFEEEEAATASMPFACGTSKAYLRAGALEHLEILRYGFLSHQAKIIQKEARRVQAKRNYASMHRMIVSVQSLWRGFVERRKFIQKRNATLRLKAWFFQQKSEQTALSKQIERASVQIQTCWRVVASVKKYQQLRRAAITIQKKYRQYHGDSRSPPVEQDMIGSGVLDLLRRVALRRGALSSDRFSEHLLLTEVEATLRDLGIERMGLLRKTKELEAKVSKSEAEQTQAITEVGLQSQRIILGEDNIIEWERPRSKQQSNAMAAKLKELQTKVSLSREKLGALRSDNNSLIRERNRWKQHASELESAANKLKVACEKKVKYMESRLLESEKERETIVNELNQTIQRDQKAFREEKAELCKILEEADKKHRRDMDELRDGLLQAQETQQQFRSKANQLQAAHLKEVERLKTEMIELAATKDSEIAKLEEKVKKLEVSTRDAKEVYQSMLQDAEETHQKDTHALQAELRKAQEEQRELKAELSELQTAHAEELEKRVSKTLDYDNKETEIAKLQKVIQEHEEKSKNEKEELRMLMEEAEENYEDEIRALKEEVFYAQESQRQLQSELSELQTVHAEELESVKKEAEDKIDGSMDTQVSELQEQLQQQEQTFREEKEELCKMLREADEKHQAEIMGLKEEVREAQDAHHQLRSELNKMQEAHAEEVEKMLMDMVECHDKDDEVAKLKEVIRQQEGNFDIEKGELYDKLKEHLEEVRLLKEEFVETQNAHKYHLHCILDMLEDMDADREANMAQLLDELDTIQHAKDSKIEELAAELVFERARKEHSSDLSTIAEDAESSSTNSELSLARRTIEEHAFERMKRSNDFNGTLKKLQLAVKPENMKYIFEKLQRQQYESGAEMKVFAEIHRMSKVLGDLYAIEEHSQERIDKNTLALLDRFLATTCHRSRA